MKKEEPIDRIEADSIIVEVTDKHSGKKFKRHLPIRYLETDNGLVLFGETAEGQPTSISFFSDTALARLNDILGKGPDTHKCQQH